MIRLLGMGNALTDVHLNMDTDSLLEELCLPKGSMQLIDEYQFKIIAERTLAFNKSISCGGSAANTVTGASKLGVPCSFFGKIGLDEIGRFYRKDMESYGVKTTLLVDEVHSGQALAFVSQDGERTFATYLGAAANIDFKELDLSLFENQDLLYLEGYLIFNQQFVLTALRMAQKMGIRIAIDLASYNVVEANKAFVLDILEKYVDIVFANEEEAKALTGADPEQALDFLANLCETAVVKVGAKGAYAKTGDLRVFVPAIEAKRVDTTGAGDLFAAGFIYGLHQGFHLKECTRCGSIAAGKVIEVLGPKMSPETWVEIKSLI